MGFTDYSKKMFDWLSGTLATFPKINGTAAHDAAASGNPVQVGGVYRTADPALTNGDVGSLRVNAKGEALVEVTGSIVGTPDAAAPTEAALIGVKYSSADPAVEDGDLAAARGNSKGELAVNLASALDKDVDSIDVAKMSKGGVATPHSAITASVVLASCMEIDCRGFNSLLMYITSSATDKRWTFEVYGSMTSGGTFVPWYELANTGALVAMSVIDNVISKGFTFRGIPDYIKIVPTETDDGATVTVKAQPFNL